MTNDGRLLPGCHPGRAARGSCGRSFVRAELDYQRTENKSFNEQLRMGRFSLTASQREAIMTFVLGLVAEPAGPAYLFQPDPRRKAIVQGRKVLDKYACQECHTLRMEEWTIEYDPAKFPARRQSRTIPFSSPRFPRSKSRPRKRRTAVVWAGPSWWACRNRAPKESRKRPKTRREIRNTRSFLGSPP